MAAVSVRSNDGNPASAGGGRMVRFAGFTAEAPAVGSAAEEGAAGTVAEAAAGGGGGVRRTRGAHELVLTHSTRRAPCVRVSAPRPPPLVGTWRRPREHGVVAVSHVGRILDGNLQLHLCLRP